MKAFKKYLFILGLTALTACKKENITLKASIPESDPYTRIDNASSEIDHQVYLVYQQSQIPILYTDTLTKNPMKIVNLNYQLSGNPSAFIYTYPKSEADILTGINFVKSSILPPLGAKIKMHSISLLDSLKTVAYGITTNYTVFNGLTTFGIANVPAISTMTTVQLKNYKAEILTNLLVNPLTASNVLASFNAVSADFYNKYAYGTALTISYVPLADKRNYGFILDGTESPSGYSTGGQPADLKLFLTKMFTMTSTDFQTQYEAYPLIMSKYNLLKTALITVGFDLTKI